METLLNNLIKHIRNLHVRNPLLSERDGNFQDTNLCFFFQFPVRNPLLSERDGNPNLSLGGNTITFEKSETHYSLKEMETVN